MRRCLIAAMKTRGLQVSDNRLLNDEVVKCRCLFVPAAWISKSLKLMDPGK